jgi:hypothetical protein
MMRAIDRPPVGVASLRAFAMVRALGRAIVAGFA